jgi:hypothetical protein
MTAKQAKTDGKPEDKDKVFDVSKPGESAAEPTSKPVIVKRNMVKNDPMVVEEESSPAEAPTSGQDKPQKPAEEDTAQAQPAKESQDTQPPPEEAPNEPETDQTGQESQPEGSGNAEAPDGSAEVSTLAEEADAAKSSKKQAAQEAQETEARQKLIDSKQYYLNIGEIKRRRTNAKLLMALLFAVILAAVVFDLALDAEIIDSGIQPLTDIL